MPIAEFGGIQEALARAGREGYAVLAGAELMNAIVDNHEAPRHFVDTSYTLQLMSAIVDNHEAPMVLSSIMKQSCTERLLTPPHAFSHLLTGSDGALFDHEAELHRARPPRRH